MIVICFQYMLTVIRIMYVKAYTILQDNSIAIAITVV